MKDNKTILPALIAFFGGIILVWLFTPKDITKLYDSPIDDEIGGARRRYIPDPTFNTEDLQFNSKAANAVLALKSYISAWNAGETENDLNKLNKELLKTFNAKIKNRDTELVVVDENDKTILINKII